MKNLRKPLGQAIVYLRKIQTFLSFLLEVLGESVGKGKTTGTPAETVDIYSVVHRSLSNPFVPTLLKNIWYESPRNNSLKPFQFCLIVSSVPLAIFLFL